MATYNIFGTHTPATPSAADFAEVTLGSAIRVNKSGYITHLRCYSGDAAADFDSMRLYLWDGSALSGTEVASVSFTGTPGSGWIALELSAPVRVYAGNLYMVTLLSSNGRYPYEAGIMTGAGTEVFVSPSHEYGFYSYGNSFPVYTATSGAGYFVDVVFEQTEEDEVRLWPDLETSPLTSETDPITLATRFTVAAPTLVTHLRAPSVSNTLTSLRLWQEEEGPVVLAEETVSSWKGIITEIELDTPILLLPGFHYIVSGLYGGGKYHARTYEFDGVAVTAGPVTAFADGTDGYANGGFDFDGTSTHLYPDQTFNSSTYFLDVVAKEQTSAPPVDVLGDPAEIAVQGSSATFTVGPVPIHASGSPAEVAVQGSTATFTVGPVPIHASGSPAEVAAQGSTATFTLGPVPLSMAGSPTEVVIQGSAATFTVGTAPIRASGSPAEVVVQGSSATVAISSLAVEVVGDPAEIVVQGSTATFTLGPAPINASGSPAEAVVQGSAATFALGPAPIHASGSPAEVVVQGSAATFSIGSLAVEVVGDPAEIVVQGSAATFTVGPVPIHASGSPAEVVVQGSAATFSIGFVPVLFLGSPAQVTVEVTSTSFPTLNPERGFLEVIEMPLSDLLAVRDRALASIEIVET